MIKIQSPEKNNFQRAKRFHKIKYYTKIKEQLIKKKGLIGSTFILEVNLLDKIEENLEKILIGDADEINSIIKKIDPYFEAIKNNTININEKPVSIEKLLTEIFNYKDFSKEKLYNKSINEISNWKNDIKNRKRKGTTKGDFDIDELRNSIIKSIIRMSNIYTNTRFEIEELVQIWRNKVLDFDISDVNNISKEDLLIFEEMKIDLIYKRNEFWGNYNDFKNCMSKREMIQFWGGYNFVKEIDIMTCPYCNRIYTNLIIGSKKSYKPALDHYYPESKYPYPALSLFNLIPCCDICNSSFKSDSILEIHNVYETGYENDYIFKYEIIDISKPITNTNINIKIEAENEKCKCSDNNISLFELKSAYSTHKDIVVKMWGLRRKYNDCEIKRLIDLGIYTSAINFVEQMVVSGPIDKDRFHEIPLAKFKRDIAYQLGFLKKL